MPKVPQKPGKLPTLEGGNGDDFGEPPALYIAQYGRLIDTRYIRPPPPLPPEGDEDRLTDLGRNARNLCQYMSKYLQDSS